MAWAAKEVDIVGIVIDGEVQTTELLINREGMPIFCRGSTTGQFGGDVPGSINEPVICGRVIVKPGDIIIADEEGIVSLRLERAKALLVKAGQGRGKPFPPEGRKVPFNSRGHEDNLRKLPNIEWKSKRAPPLALVTAHLQAVGRGTVSSRLPTGATWLSCDWPRMRQPGTGDSPRI